MERIKITLTKKEIDQLQSLIKKGVTKARIINRSRILLLANKQKASKDIADILDIGRITVARIKKKYVEGGLKYALEDMPRPGQPIKITDKDKAEIIAAACSNAPKGRKRWTVRLLAQETKKMLNGKSISRESVRLVLKKAKLNLG